MEQQEIRFEFDDNFQLGVFELMMADRTFCDKALAMLRPEYFKNDYYAWFFRSLEDLAKNHGGSPSHLQLRNQVMQLSHDKRELYLKVYNRIVRPQLQRDHQYIRNQLTKFAKKAIAWQINDRIVRGQHKDPDRILDEVQKEFERFQGANFEGVQTQRLSQLPSIMEQAAEEAQFLIPTFMPTIDREMGGGVPRKTLTVGLSGTNAGKSVWMANWTYHLIRNGYKVLVCNFEGWQHQWMLRLVSRHTGARFGDVRFNRLTDHQMQLRMEFEQQCNDKLEIFHDNTFGFTFEDLIPILRQKKDEMNYDAVMLDYGQILGSKRKFNDLRHQMTYIHRGLSSLAGELDCAMATVAQGTRGTQEKGQKGSNLIRMNDISECFEIVRAAATVFTLNRSDDDIQGERARILMDKQRDGRTNVIEVCKTDFQRLAYYGPESEGLGFMTPEQYIQESGGNK